VKAFIVKDLCSLIRCLGMDILLLHVFASTGMCLRSRLAMGLYATVVTPLHVNVPLHSVLTKVNFDSHWTV
jgi:hypothetical protein